MADYAKKTVAELTEILKSRGLPSSGKKAELVARLNQNDQEAETVDETPAQEAAPTTAAPVPAPSEPTAQPTAESAPQTDANNAATSTTDTTATATGAEPQPESTTYTLNLKASDLDSELAKRKARAERFGTAATAAPATTATNGEAIATAIATATATATSEPTAEDQGLKNLERAKRFGTQTTAINKLDEALPTERARGNNKRKAEDSSLSSALDDPGLKRSFANRSGSGGGGAGAGPRPRGGRFQNRGSHKQGPGRVPGAGGVAGGGGISKTPAAPAYTSEKDKLAAEARKKKFATA